ncbi:MAG: hypothetical protein QOD72_333, partial [Acidimicrobiaceae bacterium]|nr:hypothetical protein [Acidimicrobiaceae bacterium]
AKIGNVLSSVSGTGNVIAPSSESVSFDSSVSSNKVTQILVKVGDTVTAGQPLATVDDTTTAAALASAQAQLASAQAAVDKAQNPVTPDVIAQDQAAATQASAAVQNAQAAVANAENALASDTSQLNAALQQAQVAYNDAQAKNAQDTTNAQTAVTQAQAQVQTDNAAVAAAQTALGAAQAQLTSLSNDQAACTANAANPNYTPADGIPCAQVAGLLTSAQQAATTAQSALASAQSAASKDAQALQSAQNAQASLVASTKQSEDQATNAVASAQNNLDVKLPADQVAIDTANRNVTTTQASQTATLASNAEKEKAPTADDLAGVQAGLVNAQNALATAQRNEADTTLTAPGAGTIAASTAQLGAAAGSGSASSSTASSSSTSASSSSSAAGLFTLTDLTSLQVKVGLSESDATNVKVGQAATITFASLAGVSATGKVTQVDLTATTVSNVVTYYAYVSIDPSAALAPVKPGMTATVQVVVNHADNVVYLPTSAVTARGTTATVNVEVGNDPSKTTATQITLGLRGDSSIEVRSGLKAGDNVVVARAASTAGTTATATAGAGAARTGTGAPGAVGGAPTGGLGG